MLIQTRLQAAAFFQARWWRQLSDRRLLIPDFDDNLCTKFLDHVQLAGASALGCCFSAYDSSRISWETRHRRSISSLNGGLFTTALHQLALLGTVPWHMLCAFNAAVDPHVQQYQLNSWSTLGPATTVWGFPNYLLLSCLTNILHGRRWKLSLGSDASNMHTAVWVLAHSHHD